MDGEHHHAHLHEFPPLFSDIDQLLPNLILVYQHMSRFWDSCQLSELGFLAFLVSPLLSYGVNSFSKPHWKSASAACLIASNSNPDLSAISSKL